MNLIDQTIKAPYITLDVEDTDPTNAFVESSDLDFVRFTVFCVADLSFTSGSTVGADEVSKAVRSAIDKANAIAGTYNGETITRCTLERGGQFQNNSIANKPQITKEDEYILSLRVDKVSAPTNLVLTPNYNWINLSYSAIDADSVNIYLSIDGGSSTFLENTSDLTSYDYFQTIDQVNLLEFSIESVVGSQTSTRVSFNPYPTWTDPANYEVDAKRTSQYTLSGSDVLDYTTIEGDNILMLQTTPAQYPTVDNPLDITKIQILASASQFLSNNTLDVAKLAAMQTGMITYVNDGMSTGQFTMGALTGSNYIRVGRIGAFMGFELLSTDAGTRQLRSVSSTIPVGVPITIIFDKTNVTSKYRMFADEVEVSINMQVGANDGTFLANLMDIDTVSLGSVQRLSPLYYDADVKFVKLHQDVKTDNEIAQFHRYIKNVIL